MDPGTIGLLVAEGSALAAIAAAYSLGKTPGAAAAPAAAPAAPAAAPAAPAAPAAVVAPAAPAPAAVVAPTAPAPAAAAPADAPAAPADAPAAPAAAPGESVANVRLPPDRDAPPESDQTPLENIVDEAIIAAKAEAAKPASKSMFQRLRDYRPFADARDARAKAYTGRKTQGGRRKKTQRRGGANPVIAPFVARITKKLYSLTESDPKPQIAFSHLLSAGGATDDTPGDILATLLLPVMRSFTWWRFRILFAKIRYSPVIVADAEDLYKDIVLPQQIQRIFAHNDRILYKIKFGKVPIDTIENPTTAAAAVAIDSSNVPENPPPALPAEDDKEFIGPRQFVEPIAAPAPAAPLIPASPEAAAALAAEAAAIEARPVQPLPQQRPAVEVEGAPGAGTGLFAAPAAALPDTAAIQEAETRVREEAAAALAAAKAAATEERNAAVQATEKRIREEAAAAQATLEMRAVAAENALELNKGDVAKKAAELLELRASAEKHENDARIAATAAKEQEARAQRAEGQLNAAKEALQTLSVGHMSTSSRVPSLAESEAKVRRLQENQLLAEAQAKSARTDAPPSTGDSSLSDVVDRIEEPASPVAAPAAVAPPPLPEMVGLRTPFETGNSAAVPHPRGKTPPQARASLLAAHAALGLPNPPATESRLRSTLPKLTPEEKKKYQGLTPSKVGMRIPLRGPLKKGGRRKTSKKRKTRKSRKSTFRRHRKH